MENLIMEKNNSNLLKILGLIKYPLLTEKTFNLFNKNEYTFIVNKSLRKDEIKSSLEKIFNVKILRINSLILAPKFRRVGRFLGKKSTYKKIIIKLKKDDFIPDIFN